MRICSTILLLIIFIVPIFWPFAGLYILFQLASFIYNRLYPISPKQALAVPSPLQQSLASSNVNFDGEWFINSHDQKLFTHYWPANNPKAVILIAHGLAEHAGRYAYVATELNKQEYSVLAIDHQGHGLSEGEIRAFTNDFEAYVDDLHLFFEKATDHFELGQLPRFLLGHSMGGMIATLHARSHPDYWDGVILSGPALGVPDANDWTFQALGFLTDYFPTATLKKLDQSNICSDPEVVKEYIADPLNSVGPIRAMTVFQLVKKTFEVAKDPKKNTFPFILMYGVDDKIIDTAACARFYAEAPATDKTLRPFEKMRHEILNEPEKDQVIQLIVEWIEKHLEQ